MGFFHSIAARKTEAEYEQINSFNPTYSRIFYIIIYTIFAALKNSLKITSSWELNTLNTNNLA